MRIAEGGAFGNSEDPDKKNFSRSKATGRSPTLELPGQWYLSFACCDKMISVISKLKLKKTKKQKKLNILEEHSQLMKPFYFYDEKYLKIPKAPSSYTDNSL